MKVWAFGREVGTTSMCIRLLITEPPIAPIILTAGSTGNLLNQLLWISGPLWLATSILPLLHKDAVVEGS